MVESETQNSIRMKLFCHSSVPSNNGSIFQPFDLFLSLATDPKRLIDGRYRHRERARYRERGSVGENLNPSKLLAENHFDPDSAKMKPKSNIRRLLLPLLNNGDLSINDSVLLLLLLQQKESLEREREHTQGLFCFGVAS